MPRKNFVPTPNEIYQHWRSEYKKAHETPYQPFPSVKRDKFLFTQAMKMHNSYACFLIIPFAIAGGVNSINGIFGYAENMLEEKGEEFIKLRFFVEQHGETYERQLFDEYVDTKSIWFPKKDELVRMEEIEAELNEWIRDEIFRNA